MNCRERTRTGDYASFPKSAAGRIPDFRIFNEFKDALNRGEVRAAAKQDADWTVNFWVKQGILLGFKMESLKNFSVDNNFRFFDKHTFPLKRLTIDDGVRVVPGGSSIRDGVYMGKGVTCMPPMYVNAGGVRG